tara:strand:+ start:1013 stop:1678 length:666 start_codon:yes stop_codon:yes gene_type:complete
MRRKADPTTLKLLEKYKLGKEAVWDCHGTWVILHKYLEHIGQKNKVDVSSLEVIECSTEKQFAVVRCTASSDQKTVITFGEASPKNNKNAYPFAMAEKRAVGRAILKLAGLHGHFYEDEFPVDNNVYSQTGKPDDASGSGNKSTAASSQHHQDLPPGWDEMDLVTQIQTFSSVIEKATHPGQVDKLKTPYEPWFKKQDREVQKELIEKLASVRKGILNAKN